MSKSSQNENYVCEFHENVHIINILTMLFSNEIPMRKFSHQPKMKMRVFHLTIKNQIINR